MPRAFSDQSDIFGLMLLLSLAGHLALLPLGIFFIHSAQFSIEQAPRSMEVMLVQESRITADELPVTKIAATQIPENEIKKEDPTFAQENFSNPVTKPQAMMPAPVVRKEINPVHSKEIQPTVLQIPKTETRRAMESNPSKGAIVRLPPAALINPAPEYPNLARRSGWEGKTIVKVLVDSLGNARRVDIAQSSGHPILDDSAMQTIRQWRFSPAKRGVEKIDAWIVVPVEFILTDKTP